MKNICLSLLLLWLGASSATLAQGLKEVELLLKVAPTTVGGELQDFGWFPDSKRIAFLELAKDKFLINIYSIETEEFVVTVPLDSLDLVGIGPYYAGLVVAMQGTKVVVGNGNFAVYDVETGQVEYYGTEHTGAVQRASRLVVSEDETKVAKLGNLGVYVLDLSHDRITFTFLKDIDFDEYDMKANCFVNNFEYFCYTFREGDITTYHRISTVDKSSAQSFRFSGYPQVSPNGEFLYSLTEYGEQPLLRMTVQQMVPPYDVEIIPLSTTIGAEPNFSIDPAGEYLLTTSAMFLVGYDLAEGDQLVLYNSFEAPNPTPQSGDKPILSPNMNYLVTYNYSDLHIYSSPLIDSHVSKDSPIDCESFVTQSPNARVLEAHIQLGTSSTIDISIHDFEGRLVYEKHVSELGVGEHVLELYDQEILNLSTGTYFVSITMPTGACSVSTIRL